MKVVICSQASNTNHHNIRIRFLSAMASWIKRWTRKRSFSQSVVCVHEKRISEFASEIDMTPANILANFPAGDNVQLDRTRTNRSSYFLAAKAFFEFFAVHIYLVFSLKRAIFFFFFFSTLYSHGDKRTRTHTAYPSFAKLCHGRWIRDTFGSWNKGISRTRKKYI